MSHKNRNFQPRVIPPREPERRSGVMSFLLFVIIAVTIAGLYGTEESYNRGYEAAVRATVRADVQKDTASPPPEKDDAQPLHLETLPSGDEITVLGHSEALPESDPGADMVCYAPPGQSCPVKPKSRRAAKAEPTADELNARWLVRYPHGAPRLVPVL